MFDTAVHRLYDRLLRSVLPRKIAVFNGVAVRQPRLLDRTDVRPDYEGALVDAIIDHVRDGDNVVVVGGGWGVTTVVAARQVGDGGRVTVYEGAGEQVGHVEETLRLNKVADRVRVEHAVVGHEVRLYGDRKGAGRIDPAELPECDVLVLDCEGAELDVLGALAGRPRVIMVETHPMYDAPAPAVWERLADAGYEVVEERLESTPYGDLPVLTGVREEE